MIFDNKEVTPMASPTPANAATNPFGVISQ